MKYDIQVVGQGALYLAIALVGIVTALPIGITVAEFGSQCCLYTKFSWVNGSYANVELSSSGVCYFPVFTAVFGCIMYALAVGAYHLYAAFHTKNSSIGSQMWVMPFLLVNSLVTVLMFIASVMVSVGIRSTCDSLLSGQSKGSKISSCPDGVTYDWNARDGKPRTDYTYSHFYSFTKTSEVSGWIAVMAWVVQMALCFLQLVRNRRGISREVLPDYDEASEDGRSAGADSFEKGNHI